MKIGDIVKVSIYGKIVEAEILVIRPFGTLDVMRLSDEKCFRISGLMIENEPCTV